MTIKPLVLLPDPILRKVCLPVEEINLDITRLAEDMLETMYYSQGCGLAAIQVGILYRLVVVDISRKSNDDVQNPLVFINPEIVSTSEDFSVYQEGCLSIPGYMSDVRRPASIVVKYQDCSAQHQIIYADGLLATCLQHEIDHLNGVLFIDRISRLKRDMVMRKFSKLARFSV
ncbi:peptide deformylase [Candidatus Liberibacter sp.]|uniref:peptide deformylase n=1 Tax=Candidatus Liberibacter sp. TaxID=34022 RepID=UPI0015F4B8EA|nr:peptide deformylase [Candidatus Liberibacter sp.]MBA5724262.1 peptide deformylase [Candidatus Liberibacter sp.]